MSIFGKLKGDKSAGKSAAKDAETKPAEQARPEMKRSWTTEDMRQIHRSSSMPRMNSEISSRPSNRHSLPRSSSSYPQGWNMPKNKSALRPHARPSSSYASISLAQVMEDGNLVPPVPPMPTRFSQTSISRPSSSRSPYSNSSFVGRSHLSTAETTPAGSDDSSSASTKSDDVLEMRAHPWSRQEQFVFRKSQIVETSGKGKGPMTPNDRTLTTNDEPSNRPPTSGSIKDPSTKRRYFNKSISTGVAASESDNSRPSTAPASPKDSLVSPKPKKSRFNLFNKKGGNAIAAH